MEKEFTVKWEIQVSASTKREAAKKALEMFQDKLSTATIFSVVEFDNTADEEEVIDAAEIAFDKLTPENASDIMVTALEGGINYWCGKVKIENIPDALKNEANVYASEVLGYDDGVLLLYDAEDVETSWKLTKQQLIEGIEKYMNENGYADITDLIDDHDAETADIIIQYALFNELVFA